MMDSLYIKFQLKNGFILLHSFHREITSVAIVTEQYCPVCDAAEWTESSRDFAATYKGVDFVIPQLELSECKSCGFEITKQAQGKRNEAKIRDAHRRIDGLLTGSEIKAIRKRLGLSQREAAALFGGGDNAFSKYERGEITQSVAMDRLIRLVGKSEVTFTELTLVAGRAGSSFARNDRDAAQAPRHQTFAWTIESDVEVSRAMSTKTTRSRGTFDIEPMLGHEQAA